MILQANVQQVKLGKRTYHDWITKILNVNENCEFKFRLKWDLSHLAYIIIQAHLEIGVKCRRSSSTLNSCIVQPQLRNVTGYLDIDVPNIPASLQLS